VDGEPSEQGGDQLDCPVSRINEACIWSTTPGVLSAMDRIASCRSAHASAWHAGGMTAMAAHILPHAS
jgi:hypothetical protein